MFYMYFPDRDYPVESNKNASSLSQHFEVAFSFAIFWKSDRAEREGVRTRAKRRGGVFSGFIDVVMGLMRI